MFQVRSKAITFPFFHFFGKYVDALSIGIYSIGREEEYESTAKTVPEREREKGPLIRPSLLPPFFSFSPVLPPPPTLSFYYSGEEKGSKRTVPFLQLEKLGPGTKGEVPSYLVVKYFFSGRENNDDKIRRI